jgi:hypothetical protein
VACFRVVAGAGFWGCWLVALGWLVQHRIDRGFARSIHAVRLLSLRVSLRQSTESLLWHKTSTSWLAILQERR